MPDLREALGHSRDISWDIPHPIRDSITEYKKYFPNIDSSMIYTADNLWFLDNTDM